MKKINREDCDICQGTGKIKLIPWTDAPIWEREKESVTIDCQECEEDKSKHFQRRMKIKA